MKQTRTNYRQILSKTNQQVEPEWKKGAVDISDINLNKFIEDAFNWYKDRYDFVDSLKFIEQYYQQSNVDTTNIKKITNTDQLNIGRYIGFLCRMKVKGLPRLSIKYNNILAKKLRIIEEIGKTKVLIRKKLPKKIISVQERIQQRAKSLIFDIDYVVDLYIDNNFETNFTFNTFVRVNDIKKPVAKILCTLLQERIDELENKEQDLDLKEAYSHFGKRQKNKIIKLLKDCLDGCEKITQLTTIRKTRKKRLL